MSDGEADRGEPVRIDFDPTEENSSAQGFDGDRVWDTADRFTVGTETVLVENVHRDNLKWLTYSDREFVQLTKGDGGRHLHYHLAGANPSKPSVTVSIEVLENAIGALSRDRLTVAIDEDQGMMLYDGERPVVIAAVVFREEVDDVI